MIKNSLIMPLLHFYCFQMFGILSIFFKKRRSFSRSFQIPSNLKLLITSLHAVAETNLIESRQRVCQRAGNSATSACLLDRNHAESLQRRITGLGCSTFTSVWNRHTPPAAYLVRQMRSEILCFNSMFCFQFAITHSCSWKSNRKPMLVHFD